MRKIYGTGIRQREGWVWRPVGIRKILFKSEFSLLHTSLTYPEDGGSRFIQSIATTCLPNFTTLVYGQQ
jgi:hypothetical protein